MLEMAEAGDDEGHVVGLAVLNCVAVANGAAGLYHSLDAGLIGHLHTVVEGEEGI